MWPFVPLQTAFGNYIRELRDRTGLTIEQFSERSGFSSNRLKAIEQGQVNLNLSTILILAMSLDITLQDLFNGIAGKVCNREFIQNRVIVFSNNRKSLRKSRRSSGNLRTVVPFGGDATR
jgi:transcriptional regulator with XRE-family HTH domain